MTDEVPKHRRMTEALSAAAADLQGCRTARADRAGRGGYDPVQRFQTLTTLELYSFDAREFVAAVDEARRQGWKAPRVSRIHVGQYKATLVRGLREMG